MPGSWYLYILRCADGTLYTGITNDLKNRLAMHNSGRGAKYMVPSRRPAVVAFKRRCKDMGRALRLERRVKDMNRLEKEELVKGKLRLR